MQRKEKIMLLNMITKGKNNKKNRMWSNSVVYFVIIQQKKIKWIWFSKMPYFNRNQIVFLRFFLYNVPLDFLGNVENFFCIW